MLSSQIHLDLRARYSRDNALHTLAGVQGLHGLVHHFGKRFGIAFSAVVLCHDRRRFKFLLRRKSRIENLFALEDLCLVCHVVVDLLNNSGRS